MPRGASIFTTGAQLGEERVARQLGAERRRRAVAGEDDGLGRVGIRERADRGQERVPVAERQVGSPDRAGEEDVAGEERAVGVVGEVAGEWPGTSSVSNVMPASVERLVAVEQHVGVVRRESSVPGREVGRFSSSARSRSAM